jgi:hypothetical protein
MTTIEQRCRDALLAREIDPNFLLTPAGKKAWERVEEIAEAEMLQWMKLTTQMPRIDVFEQRADPAVDRAANYVQGLILSPDTTIKRASDIAA